MPAVSLIKNHQYAHTRLRAARGVVVKMAAAGKAISARSIQSEMKGTRFSRQEVELLRAHAQEKGFAVIAGTHKVQPKWQAKIDARYKQMKQFVIGNAMKKRPISPTQFKKQVGGRIEVAKVLFDRACADPEVLAQLKKLKVEVIRAEPVGMHDKKD